MQGQVKVQIQGQVAQAPKQVKAQTNIKPLKKAEAINARYKTMANFVSNTNHKYSDFSGDEYNYIPKFMTIIKLKEKKQNIKNINTNINLTKAYSDTPINFYPEDYYIDTLENFLSLEYTPTLNDTKDVEKLEVRHPYRANIDLIDQYQKAKIIGK